MNTFELTDFMLKAKSFLDHTNLFSANENNENNDKTILMYFQLLKCF